MNEAEGQVLSSSIQAVGNYAGAVAANKKQFKNQMKAMAKQQEYNRQMWDYQNAYNTPAQQMARLKAAGLNPYLMYGNSQGASGNAGPMTPTDVPAKEEVRPQFPDAMAKYLSARQADAQYAATLQAMDNAKTKNDLMAVQMSLENLKLMREQIKSKYYPSLEKSAYLQANWLYQKTRAQVTNEQIKGELMGQMHDQRRELYKREITSRDLENEFRENRNALAKLGVYQSDHPILRVLIATANRIGVPLEDVIKEKIGGGLKYLFD